MICYEMYGSNTDIQELRPLVGQAFAMKCTERESAYFGVYFVYGDRQGENFQLKTNIDLTDGEPLELKFPDYRTLLFVNRTTRSAEIYETLVTLGLTRLTQSSYDE